MYYKLNVFFLIAYPCVLYKVVCYHAEPYAIIISTDTVNALIDTIITLDKNIIDYIMKY